MKELHGAGISAPDALFLLGALWVCSQRMGKGSSVDLAT